MSQEIASKDEKVYEKSQKSRSSARANRPRKLRQSLGANSGDTVRPVRRTHTEWERAATTVVRGLARWRPDSLAAVATRRVGAG